MSLRLYKNKYVCVLMDAIICIKTTYECHIYFVRLCTSVHADDKNKFVYEHFNIRSEQKRMEEREHNLQIKTKQKYIYLQVIKLYNMFIHTNK